MPLHRLLKRLVILWVLAACVGCSSLGLSCFPTGHYLTEESAAVLEQSPRHVQVPRELEQGVVPVHYLQPGDGLLIEPVDLESDVRIPADQHVMADGSLDLSAFGRVMVAGLSLEMAENLIERTIVDAGEQKTRINVQLIEPVHRYYVLGEVNSPGSYPLEGHENVLDGILAAGGLTSAAAPCKILLARPTVSSSCRVTLPVCYREITQLGDTTTNYQIQPGDRIFVASRTWSEELKFWEVTKTCARCRGCQAACVDPSIVGYRNPVTQVAAGQSTVVAGQSTVALTTEPWGASTLDNQTHAGPVMVDSTPFEVGLSKSPDERSRTVVTALPTQLPAEGAGLPSDQDGELEFDASDSRQRFEPLWITSPDEAPTAE